MTASHLHTRKQPTLEMSCKFVTPTQWGKSLAPPTSKVPYTPIDFVSIDGLMGVHSHLLH